MRRIFHVPAHLDYVSKLTTTAYMPVPSPSGVVLRVADLLELEHWDFFDVLHLHTVELATAIDLMRLGERLRQTGKTLVFTAHDLAPNIEDDHVAFKEKTWIAITHASAVVTLTSVAAKVVATSFGVRPAVIPHGFAVSPEHGRPSFSGRAGFLVFGALRPNRDLLGVIRAWRLLPTRRPPLRILVRSLGPSDRRRYAAEIDDLNKASHQEPDLTVELYERTLPPAELIDRCQRTTTLVLPYRTITHSGQLELARDLTLAVIAPDVPTLRAQLSETGNGRESVIWFPSRELRDERLFVQYLSKVVRLPRSEVLGRHIFSQFRRHEHRRILGQYGAVYNLRCTQR